MSERDVVRTATDVDLETPEADAAEQAADTIGGEQLRPEPLKVPFDADEADAAEQAADVIGGEQLRREPLKVPFDADEADAADQHWAVDLDEDDYR